jgi:hypothetical protein
MPIPVEFVDTLIHSYPCTPDVVVESTRTADPLDGQ